VRYEQRIKSREAFYEFLQKLPPHVVVLIETGPGAQAWPTEQDRSEGMPSLGEAPNVRGKSVWLLCAGRRSAFQSDPQGRNHKRPLPQQRICTPPHHHTTTPPNPKLKTCAKSSAEEYKPSPAPHWSA
jgi:proteasome lid subunit RPN8/RPN11